MSSWQKILVTLTAICAIALLAPVAALATGPSAGDQQYIDPLGNSHHGSGQSGSSSGSSSSSSSTPSSATPTATSSSSSAAATTTASATPASSSTVSSTAGDPATLPRTGYDDLAIAGLGVCLLASGVYLRRVTRQT